MLIGAGTVLLASPHCSNGCSSRGDQGPGQRWDGCSITVQQRADCDGCQVRRGEPLALLHALRLPVSPHLLTPSRSRRPVPAMTVSRTLFSSRAGCQKSASACDQR